MTRLMRIVAPIVLALGLVVGLLSPAQAAPRTPDHAQGRANFSHGALKKRLKAEGMDLVSAEVEGDTVSVEATSTLASGEEVTHAFDFDATDSTAVLTVDDAAPGPQQTIAIQVHEATDGLVWFTATDAATGERVTFRSDQAEFSAIPLIIALPSAAAMLKALIVASAVVVIAGVTFVAAEKAISAIREEIRRGKRPPAHYMAILHNGGLMIGNGLSLNEAISRARAGSNTWSTTKSGAAAVARGVRAKTPVGPEKDKMNASKKFCHYHPAGRSPGSHAFYGVAGQVC